MAQQQQIRRNGFIYSKGTSAGFLRMQRLGIPRPAFKVEDKITKEVSKVYNDMLYDIMREFVEEVQKANGVIQDDKLTTDASKNAFLAELKKANKKGAGKQTSRTVNTSAVISAQNALRNKWQAQGETIKDLKGSKLESELAKQLTANQSDYLGKLLEDAPEQMVDIIKNFSIDQREVFNANMDNLKALYLNDSLERIGGEQNDLKRAFLQKLDDYIEGRADTLDIKDLVNEMALTGIHEARFFARDQMQKFNKALTLSTFVNAGVTKVEWCTCQDQRVRPSHKALNGKIFDINNLPPEINDYNCRCGLIPAN